MSNLNYVARGDGPPVILLHGIAASLYDWEALAPDLAAAGYRAFAVDLPGHGDSEKPDEAGHYSAGYFYQAVETWLDSLKDGPPFILVGHSYGGYLSLRYALRHPERVRALLLIAPFYSTHQLPTVLRFFHRTPSPGILAMPYLPLWLIDLALGWDPINARFSPNARWQIAVDYKRAAPQVLNLPRTSPDLSPEIGQVEIPALVIWGEHDRTLNPASFPQLIARLPAGHGLCIPHSGHQPHIGDPDQVNRQILEFLQYHASSPQAGSPSSLSSFETELALAEKPGKASPGAYPPGIAPWRTETL